MTFLENYNNIIQDVELYLNTNKLRQDLFDMLKKENVEFKESKATELYSYSLKEGSEKKFLFSIDDDLNILSIKIEQRYFGISFIPLIVDVAIGTLKTNENGIYEIEKCKCEFMYDINKELVDADFYHDEMCFK
ncbi:hypothetical protein [Flavobacterium foetidum]|uniref:hypothetical protein n=1 Tax=Flavobacterium foetidum TaxID=2026681 RepID=UPI0010754522|nr:hypothetical protein [Flavobacterium foetidum]KAF2509090.1 hypothetical protein E0W73_18960 [Flavobacterium foetidum]